LPEPLPTPRGVVAPSQPEPPVRPRLRGVVHQWSFFVALAAGVALVVLAPAGRATVACAVYAVALCGLLGTSALYHRVTWTSQKTRRWMRRLDHSMIFVLIAGTYTPFALLVLEGTLAIVILVVVWAGAVGGVLLKLVWIDAPKPLVALLYVMLGWVAVAAFPDLLDELGIASTALVAGGGILYTAGAVVYALGRPDPAPAVFGYHEVFHALVIGAAALQYAVVAFFVLPGA
jgi:hemolysin III